MLGSAANLSRPRAYCYVTATGLSTYRRRRSQEQVPRSPREYRSQVQILSSQLTEEQGFLRSFGGVGALFHQCGLKVLLGSGDELSIAFRVDKNAWTHLRILLQLGKQIEIAPVGSKKHIAGQLTQRCKRMFEIFGDARIAYRVAGAGNEAILRPKACSSDNDDIPHRSCRLAWKMRAHRPRRASARVPSGFMGRQSYSPEANRVSVT